MFTVTNIPGVEPTALPPLWGRTDRSTPERGVERSVLPQCGGSTVGSTPVMLVTVSILADLGRFERKNSVFPKSFFSQIDFFGQNLGMQFQATPGTVKFC